MSSDRGMFHATLGVMSYRSRSVRPVRLRKPIRREGIDVRCRIGEFSDLSCQGRTGSVAVSSDH